MTYQSIPRCNWLTTVQIFFLACISICSIFSELWSLGFYISSPSGFISLLESHSVLVRPLHKDVKPEISLFCSENNLTQYKLMQKTEKMEGNILADHDTINTEKSKTVKAVENKFLELEVSFAELSEELKLEKEKSAREQIMFIRTLSDLHNVYSNKQSNLEAIIADLRRHLHAEKRRTSKQTNLIQALTLTSGHAISRANNLQRQLADLKAKVNKSKASCLKDQQQLYSKTLVDKELQRIERTSLSNSEVQEVSDRMKADLLPAKLQLYNTLQDHLFRHKIESPAIGLSKPEEKQNHGKH
ncbi:uncharacterized protein LOC130690993 [Daphnia carinata]|uniref:uncharacterized protein LOC130690993 n=1 Tax=Daphnia carinata TaxID=120202 RepID=UPI00257E6481|nr:uncharacterized protein LOC130690993 [Daphnia carinata]